MMLLAMAIEKAGSTDGDAIRKALEQLGDYTGLIKTYKAPFADASHEAKKEACFLLHQLTCSSANQKK